MTVSFLRFVTVNVLFTNGFANASASKTRKAIRIASKVRYRSRRCFVELCTRRSKNIKELKGCGVRLNCRNKCSQRGRPTAAIPAKNQGERKPINSSLGEP